VIEIIQTLDCLVQRLVHALDRLSEAS